MAFWNKKKTEPTPGAATPAPAADKKPSGWLARTAQWLNTDIRDLWKSEGELVDDDFLQKLFTVLVKSDMGGDMARTIRDRIGRDYRARKVHFEEVIKIITEEIRASLEQTGTALKMAETGPTVFLVVGVNGSGKTTSIAKLAYRFQCAGQACVARCAAIRFELPLWNS